MNVSRREFLQFSALVAAGCAGKPSAKPSAYLENLYHAPPSGDFRIIHLTDTHAQLLPVYFREPNINLGFGESLNRPPHLVGQAFLDHYGFREDSPQAHVFTYLNFSEEAARYGKLGGYEYIASLAKRLKSAHGPENTLFLDGGDSWQGSGTAYWTRGKDMVGAMNLLGIDAMTGHWEFTYLEEEIRGNLSRFNGTFLAQNVFLTEDALFEEAEAYDEDTGRAFQPYRMQTLNGHRVCVIGQAFPYTPIANPGRFIPNWSFGIRKTELTELVAEIHEREKPEVVVLLSHNGMDVDLKLASETEGIDIIMGGHTHDGVPKPLPVKNKGGEVTYVTNGGSNGKFLGCFDIGVKNGRMSGLEYRLLPVFPSLLESDAEMRRHIERVRKPHLSVLNEKIGTAGDLLYRRGNFSGTLDQVICDALRNVLGADISLSPGFRWGTSLLPGQDILMEDVLNATAMTYPETYVREISGAEIKAIFEDVADNLFNPDPYLQQGGDMVRAGGMDYDINPLAGFGKRIKNIRLDGGALLEADRKYKVAGWSTVGQASQGPPVWDVVKEHIQSEKTVRLKKFNQPGLIGFNNNQGLEN